MFENTRTFGPETVTDYEAGFKTDFNRATGGNGAITLNDASAEINGVEVEAMIQPSQSIEISGNYSHLNARYMSFKFDSISGVRACTAQSITPPKIFAGADMTCRPLQYLSPNIVSVDERFSLPLSEDVGNLSLLFSYNWTDKQPTAPLSTERFPDGRIDEPGVLLPSCGLLNATIDWRGVICGEPRMFGLRLRYSVGI